MPIDNRPNLIQFIEGLLNNARERVEKRFEITFTAEEIEALEGGLKSKYLHALNEELMRSLKTSKQPEEVVAVVFNCLRGSGVSIPQVVVDARDFNQRGVIKCFADYVFRMIVGMCLHDKELIGSDLKADITKIQSVVAALKGSNEGLPPSELRKFRMELGNSLIDPASIDDLLQKEGAYRPGNYL